MEILKGKVPGWSTPAERETAKAGRRMATVAVGSLGATLAAAGGVTAYGEYDKAEQAKRIRAIVQNPDTVKVIQRALKAVGEYEGRADGKYDKDVQIGVAQVRGDGEGGLDMKALRNLEDRLRFEGKERLADEVRQMRGGKKPKAAAPIDVVPDKALKNMPEPGASQVSKLSFADRVALQKTLNEINEGQISVDGAWGDQSDGGVAEAQRFAGDEGTGEVERTGGEQVGGGSVDLALIGSR
jgi:hypothetical protein